MSTEYLKNPEDLLIFSEVIEHLPFPTNPEVFDFTICDLVSVPPIYGWSGYKRRAEYRTDAGVLVVQKLFTYTDTGVKVTIEWLCSDGSVGLRKVVNKELNNVQLKALASKARNYIVYELAAQVAGSAIEPYYNELLHHYQSEVDLWLLDGSNDWKDAMVNEPETIDGVPNKYYQYLHIQLTNGTVMEGVLGHLNADRKNDQDYV